MQVVYILSVNNHTSADYCDMAYISASSVRRCQPPPCTLTLVTDSDTWPTLQETHNRLLDVFDRHVVAPSPGGSPKYRSRFLKTSLRHLLSGRFVFMDVDTLLIRPIDHVTAENCRFGVALDLNVNAGENCARPELREYFTKLGGRSPTFF